MRGLTARFTPGYKWLDSATIGSNDLGMFDPFTIGKIRYIDRDNAKAVLFQGALGGRPLGYDLIRVSLPRLWAGPNFNTGDYTGRGRRLRPAAPVYAQLVLRRSRHPRARARHRGRRRRHATSTTAATCDDPLQQRRLRPQASASTRPGMFDFRGLGLLLEGRVRPALRRAHGLRHSPASRRCPPATSTTRPTRPTSTSTIRSASASPSTSSTSTSAPSTSRSSRPAARPTCCSPKGMTAPGSSPARTTRPSASSPATPPASATAAGRATPSRSRRSTSTTSSPTSTSRWPRR